MKIQLIKPDAYQTTAWSGGQTTQIALYPPNGDYQKREFLYRISSATVELEVSDFTPLPGVDRYLTTLDAPLKLTHKGIRQLTLYPFEVDHFSGEWETVSEGKVRDFNLMLKGGAKGEMTCPSLRPGEALVLTAAEVFEHHLFYAAEGSAAICGRPLAQGETLQIFTEASEEIRIETPGADRLQLVYCRIQC